MASFSAGTTFTDGVANDVTAAKLAALVNAATPTSGLIQDRTAEAAIAVNDNLLIGDASDSNNLKRMTVANFRSAATFGTTTSTEATITSGTITTLNSTTGTITTGVIPTLTSITKITSGTGTAAAPAISPTGDTNTGIFFPTADTIAFAEGGTEGMRIDSSGNVGIGVVSPLNKINVVDTGITGGAPLASGSAADPNAVARFQAGAVAIDLGVLANGNTWLQPRAAANYASNFDVILQPNGGNVGIGTSTPAAKLDVNGSIDATSGTIPTLVATTLITTGTGTAAAPAIVPTGDTNTGVFFPAADIIAFSEGGTESLRINSSGNVSIGTATALSRLHVHGDLTMSNATVSTTAATGGFTLPATAAGYLTVSINGTSRKIPYYA